MQPIPNHLKLVHLYELLAASYLLRVCQHQLRKESCLELLCRARFQVSGHGTRGISLMDCRIRQYNDTSEA